MIGDIELFNIGSEVCDISAELDDINDFEDDSVTGGTGPNCTSSPGTGHEARAPPRTFSEAEASASQGS